jgi:hypothetical protein
MIHREWFGGWLLRTLLGLRDKAALGHDEERFASTLLGETDGKWVGASFYWYHCWPQSKSRISKVEYHDGLRVENTRETLEHLHLDSVMATVQWWSIAWNTGRYLYPDKDPVWCCSRGLTHGTIAERAKTETAQFVRDVRMKRLLYVKNEVNWGMK